MNIPVITSRAAQDDFNKIKGQYADIMSGMEAHTQRVQGERQMRSQDSFQQQQEMKKIQQSDRDFELKRMSLMTP